MSDTLLNGKYIKNIDRIDEKTIYINLENGNVVKVTATMVDYDDCELIIKKCNQILDWSEPDEDYWE